MLCLLEIMLDAKGAENAHAWTPHAATLIKDVLTHNLVWRAGRVASTVRKVAAACFYTILRLNYANKACLFEAAPSLLPILKTDLDDYDASTRQLICMCLRMMFEALPGAFGEQPV